MQSSNIRRDRILHSREKIFERIAENAPFGIVFIEKSGRYSYMNPKFIEMFGYRPDEIPDGKAWFSKAYPDPEYRRLVIKIWKEDLKNLKIDEKQPKVFNVTCKDGEVKTVNIITVHIGNEEFICAFEDITERLNIESALKESEEKFKNLVERSIAGVYIIQDDVFKYVNRRFAEIHGYTIEELIDRLGPKDMVVPEDLPLVQEQIRKRISGEVETSHFSFRAKRKDNQIIHLEVFGSSMTYQGRPSIIGTLIDITERVRAEETIKHMAYHDILTGLPNRVLLFDRFNMAIATAQRKREKVAIMMIDLDRFKEVNDKFGHDAGDKFLQDIAKNIEKIIRKTDTVARMGGDEFIVLLPGILHLEDCMVVSKKILEVSKRHFKVEDIDFFVTASIGISVYPDDGIDPDVLIKNADIALYRAKENGKNRVEFYKN
ncbi:MAG: diguanylate cyclase [Syntrophorhabdaceae bacterium]|nr:diguanylate cyclase [Syntrophorhabdaceae bacterium]